MSDTICGHEREALKWALRARVAMDNAIQNRPHIARSYVGAEDDSTRSVGERNAAFDIDDPAKLATIAAELLRWVGFSVDGDEYDDKQTAVDVIVRDSVIVLMVCDPDGYQTRKDCTMPQARAFILALLDAPLATVLDIEQMIGALK